MARAWERRRMEAGLCCKCDEPNYEPGTWFCLKHLIEHREQARARKGCVRRYKSRSYRLQRQDMTIKIDAVGESHIQGALYYAYPGAASEERASGVLVGLVDGLIAATGAEFPEVIAYLKMLAHKKPFGDLTPTMVYKRLPECWRDAWKAAPPDEVKP